MRKKSVVFAYSSIIAALVLALLFSTTAAYYVKNAESYGSYGEIALRSYYDSGSGTLGDPYVITRPRHLYNLSRLQGLGVYTDPDYAHFQLGKNMGTAQNPDYKCYPDDDDTDQSHMVPYLDMSHTSYNYEPIIAIGSETTPFYGVFDGKNLEIKDLNVYADPQDAGLFGYTAHGSVVKNLFLDNITINTMGYNSVKENGVYRTLYGDDDALANFYSGDTLVKSTALDFDKNGDGTMGSGDHTFTRHDSYRDSGTLNAREYWVREKGMSGQPSMTDQEYAAYLAAGAKITIKDGTTKDGFSYKLLPSGRFLVKDGNGVKVDLASVYAYFWEKNNDATLAEEDKLVFSSSVSLCVTKTDQDGMDHTNVLLGVRLQFTYLRESENDTTIYMNYSLSQQHDNNIGFLIGHCDGSAEHCYVHDGEFVMNDGDHIVNPQGSTTDYEALKNYSSIGLIGLIGDTVKNSSYRGAGTQPTAGKRTGVLNFSDIYEKIVDESTSWSGGNYTRVDDNPNHGWYFKPKNNVEYLKYLRKKSSKYVTQSQGNISLLQRQVISNEDLGVFTIATDYHSAPNEDGASLNLENSVIQTADVMEGQDDYYVYYSTGEYVKGNDNFKDQYDVEFANYCAALTSDIPSQILLGHHFPHQGTVTRDSFRQRERFQNYFIRFKLDSGRASNFYFSDLDTDTVGGSFLSKYFHYKLVNEDSEPIDDDTGCGISLLNYKAGQPIAIDSFGGAFKLPSGKDEKINCLYAIDEENNKNHSGANTINFTIETGVANVTVVAAPAESGKPAVLGLYKYDIAGDLKYKLNPSETELTRVYDPDNENPDFLASEHRWEDLFIDRSFKNPDYAFFMPRDNRLAYFDYGSCMKSVEDPETHEVTQQESWSLGVRNPSSGTFTPATASTPATIAGFNEYDHVGSTRLFAHTFKLPPGRYCIASPKMDDNIGAAKVFYVCAQGQTKGQIDQVNNVSDETVKNIDFIQKSRSSFNSGEINTPSNWRCYVQLAYDALTGERSYFDAHKAKVQFKYSNGAFVISANEGQTAGAYDEYMTYLIAKTFKSLEVESGTNIPITLFGEAHTASEGTVYYPST